MASVSVNPIANANAGGKGKAGARSKERDLLFGLLSVQLGIVDRLELLEALRIQSVGTPWGLPEILIDLKLIDAEDREIVDRMLEEHLQKQETDPREGLFLPTGLAGGSLASPSHSPGGRNDRMARITAAWSIALLDPNLSSGSPGSITGPSLHRPSSSGEPAVVGPFGFPRMESTIDETGLRMGLTCFERYEILREHAHGGLGVISVAFDHELQREVAIKEISSPLADDSHARARFLVEAEVTGSLEHPGIVPVHSLGFRDDGRPYYVMRLIQGESLREAIIRFHGLSRHVPPLPLRDRPLELRRLLTRFVSVCNAVAFAHSKGVVHRDLKPDNIMLGAFGETLVIDWGLAKLFEGPPDEDDSGETPIPNEFKIEDSCTHPGAVIGTPGYMSPEQAEGAVDRVGPLSDIYSLGMTLRCLLSGKRPSDEEKTNANPRKKPKSPWPSGNARKKKGRWRSKNATPPFRAPRSLQAIAEKASAERPDDRYQSAQALAEDLERWLADEPVAAFVERWDESWLRWIRRHRSAARVAMVAGIVLSLGVSASTVVLDQYRRSAELQLLSFEASIANGRTSLGSDLAALAADPRLKHDPGLRKQLLRSTLNTYQFLIPEYASEPRLVLDIARAYRQIARIEADLGEYPLAFVADKRAVGTLKPLVQAHPDDLDAWRELAIACERKAADLERLSPEVDVSEIMGEALQARTAAADLNPDGIGDRLALARTQLALAAKYLDHDLADASLPYLEPARKIIQALLAAAPGSPELRDAQAEALALDAREHLHRHAPARAIASLEAARALLPHDSPRLPSIQNLLNLTRDQIFPSEPF